MGVYTGHILLRVAQLSQSQLDLLLAGVGCRWQDWEGLGWGGWSLLHVISCPPAGWPRLVLRGRGRAPRKQAEQIRFSVSSAEGSYKAKPRFTLQV